MFAIDNYDFSGKRAIIRVDFNVPLNREQRVAMLSHLVEYYYIHLEAIRSVRSIEILQEVFSLRQIKKNRRMQLVV